MVCFFLLKLLLFIVCFAKRNEILCKECGYTLSSLAYVLDTVANDSEGLHCDPSISEDYNLLYDHFPEVNGTEQTDLYYFDEIEEKDILVLPNKKPSHHFKGYTYQTVLCRRCKSTVGYLFSPAQKTKDPVFSDNGEYELSLLDFCKYTKCWDVESVIKAVLKEINTFVFTIGKSKYFMTSDLTITNQTTLSPTQFDISLLSIYDINDTSLFGYDYSTDPPSPFYSYYLSSSNNTIHIDFEKLAEKKQSLVVLNMTAGEGVTELRFKYCPQYYEPIHFSSLSCLSGVPSCRLDFCISDFGISKPRPDGSFFGLKSKNVLLDSKEFDALIDSVDSIKF